MRLSGLFALCALAVAGVAPSAIAQELIWDVAVGGVDTVFIEELTAGEVAAAIRAGKTTVIVPTGGVEQNGPHVVTGKHNYVVRVAAEATARRLGNALVAPVVPFVPEGTIDPPSGQMLYAGTISVREETFRSLLIDICASLKQHGFTDIMLIGDSGGNQPGLEAVAKRLSAAWASDPANAYYIAAFYAEDMYSYDYLKSLGIVQQPDRRTAVRNNIHTDYQAEAMVAVTDPELIRADQRIAAGDFSVHGVDMVSAQAVVANGAKLVDYRADITARAIRRAIAAARQR